MRGCEIQKMLTQVKNIKEISAQVSQTMYNAARRLPRHLKLARYWLMSYLMIRSQNLIQAVDLITLLLYIMTKTGILSILTHHQKLLQTRIIGGVDSLF